MSTHQQDMNSLLGKIKILDQKIKKNLKSLNELQQEVDFVSAKLRYACVQKNELIKKIDISDTD